MGRGERAGREKRGARPGNRGRGTGSKNHRRGTRSREPGTDRTASAFPAEGAGNPLAVLSVPGARRISAHIPPKRLRTREKRSENQRHKVIIVPEPPKEDVRHALQETDRDCRRGYGPDQRRAGPDTAAGRPEGDQPGRGGGV